MSKQAKIAAAVGAILFVCLVVWAVRTVPEPPPKDTGTQEQPHVMSYDNNTISEERDGVKIWELTADHIDVDIQTQNATMTNLKGTFYEEDGRTVAVEAPQAAYDAGTKDIAITGGVKIATSDGAAVDCGELKWTSADGKLAATGSPVITKDDVLASGERIESTDGFNKVKVIGKAHFEKGVKQ